MCFTLSTEEMKDYRNFFKPENFERYTSMYPKTRVAMKVLCTIPIPE
jgi:hypothetical protein